jgi:transaldolase
MLWRLLKNYQLAKENITKAKERAVGYASPYIHRIIDQQMKWIDMELEGKSATPTVEDVKEIQK